MRLTEISFPVYKLRLSPPSVENGRVYYAKYHKDTGDMVVSIVDDTTIEEPTLARRRLRMLAKGIKPHPLVQGIFFIGDLLKLAEPDRYFIDSVGKVFKYTKSRWVKLIYKRINAATRIPGAVLIEAEGINGRHMALYPPMEHQLYAAFLELGSKTYILYGYSDIRHPDARRKI